jgi:hypothetical protein
MTLRNMALHDGDDSGSVESWLIAAGRDRRTGSTLNVPLYPASNFVLGDRRMRRTSADTTCHQLGCRRVHNRTAGRHSWVGASASGDASAQRRYRSRGGSLERSGWSATQGFGSVGLDTLLPENDSIPTALDATQSFSPSRVRGRLATARS